MVCVVLNKQSAFRQSPTIRWPASVFIHEHKYPSAPLKKPTRLPEIDSFSEEKCSASDGFLKSSCLAQNQPRASQTTEALGWSVAFNSSQAHPTEKNDLFMIPVDAKVKNWSKVHRQSTAHCKKKKNYIYVFLCISYVLFSRITMLKFLNQDAFTWQDILSFSENIIQILLVSRIRFKNL